MRRTREVSALVVLLALLLLPAGLAQYEENIREGIFLVRPDNEYIPDTAVPLYLENEDLIFFACLEEEDTPIRLSVLCQDNNEFEDLTAYPWGPQNCYVGATNLEKFECTRALVQADYISGEENLKLSQQIRINRFSNTLNRVIQTQFSDGGWETPLDTAFGLLVINSFPEIFPERIARALEYLKINRDEIDKCWPEDGCIISRTAMILFLLEKAGLEDLRIQNDGSLYLEKTQLYVQGENWSVRVGDHILNQNNTIRTACVYEYREDLTLFNLSVHPAVRDISFQPAHEAHIGIACTENIRVTLYNEYDEQMLTYQGDNFSYTIPPPCWTRNNENLSCDRRATLFAAQTGVSSQRAAGAFSYLSGELIDDRTAGKHVGAAHTIIDDALYAHAKRTSASEVVTALLYGQSNLGGWNMTDTYYEETWFEADEDELEKLAAEINDSISRDIVATGFSVMGLLENGYERDDEVLLDAQRWVSLMEDETSLNYTDEDLTDADVAARAANETSLILNDTKRNAMAFYVLKDNARPVLLARPRLVILNRESLELDVINPTIFELEELEYELSDSLDGKVEVEEKDYVDAYSFRRITIRQSAGAGEDTIGYLRILQSGNEYLKVPILFQSTPILNITLPEEITVFGRTALLPFRVTRSDHDFSCSLQWISEGISGTTPFSLSDMNGSGTYSYPVRFSRLETENAVYEGNITCIANQVTFHIPFATNVMRFSNRPMKILPSYVELNGSGPQRITIQNALDQTIDVEITLNQQDPYLVLSESYVSLFAGEARNITIQAIPPEGENYNSSNSVVLRTFNVEERVLVEASVIHEQGGGMGPLGIALIGVIIAALAGAGYLGYRRRDELKELYTKRFKKEDIREKIYAQVRDVEREEEQTAIRNLSRIMKLQGAKDTDVRKRLLEEGYTEADIDAALSGGAPKADQKQ